MSPLSVNRRASSPLGSNAIHRKLAGTASAALIVGTASGFFPESIGVFAGSGGAGLGNSAGDPNPRSSTLYMTGDKLSVNSMFHSVIPAAWGSKTTLSGQDCPPLSEPQGAATEKGESKSLTAATE